MKIVFFTVNLEGGGVERVISTLSSYFVLNKKCQITIITLQNSAQFYELPASVSVQNLKFGALCVGPGKILFMPLLAMELCLVLRRVKPDTTLSFLVRPNLIHLMTKWLGNSAKVFVSERCNVEYDFPVGSSRSFIMRGLIRLFYHKADSIIAISKGVKKSLESLGIPAKKITVIYNPQHIDYIREKSRENSQIQTPGEPFTIITVGRFYQQKDHGTLLEAFEKIRRTLDTHLIIIGSGPMEKALRRRSKTLGISESVSWIPWQTNPFAIMEKASLFVLPSRYEGFGNVLVEAMVCGLPIVSTDCPSGPSEILSNGEHGILVPVGDSDAIARASLSILQNKALSEKMRTNGYQRADDFDVSVIGPKYLDVISP